MMMFCIRNIIFFIISFIVSSQTAAIKDVIGFPEFEENPLLVNKQDRKPVFLPSRCPENELYYPGDQVDDWICDCRAGYLFHPDTDKCWLANQKGPCPDGQFLVLRNDSMIPVCVPNPCKKESTVEWNGKCTMLGSRVCGDTYPAKVLWVNATTLNIECVEVYINNRLAVDIPSFETTTTVNCPPGCRRSVQNKCTVQIE